MASIQGAEKDGAKKQENGMRRRMLAWPRRGNKRISGSLVQSGGRSMEELKTKCEYIVSGPEKCLISSTFAYVCLNK